MKTLFIEGVIVLVMIAVILDQRHKDVTRPHHFISRVAGKVVSDFWTTNRYQIEYRGEPRYISNRFEVVTVAVTNKLW